MFFSNNSTKNGHDPFSFPDQSFFHLPISFFPFPSPFELDDDLFHQPHQFMTNSHNSASASAMAETATGTATATGVVSSEQKFPRKRSSKKDRHSKISTARGLRDRRMRLSLPVARQFFGLQDMLGVDKGSKTVEWLLIQARPEIIKLAKERNYSLDRAKSVSSSNSEGEMVSGIDEVGIGNENQKHVEKFESGMGKEKKMMMKKKKKTRQPRKTKESREMDRARARARTREKLRTRCSVDNDNANITKNYEWSKISSSWSSPFETGEESAGAQSFVNPTMAEVEKPISSQFVASEAMVDYQNSFEILGKWSPSASTFNYLQQTETLLQEASFPES